jgi:hypothetical protein
MLARSLLIAASCWLWLASQAAAQTHECSKAGIGAAALTADAPVSILTVSTEPLADGRDRYCLVSVGVGSNVNILVGLPMDGRWNGDLQAIGRGGYGGTLRPPVSAVSRGYVGVSTDTGHPLAARDPGEAPTSDWRNTTGAFAMLAPGTPNPALQNDFAHRSSHLMAVIAKQLATAFYGQPVDHAYWYGCSTEGSHGLRAVQQYPEDYDGVLAGDPAIHFAQVMAYQIWNASATRSCRRSWTWRHAAPLRRATGSTDSWMDFWPTRASAATAPRATRKSSRPIAPRTMAHACRRSKRKRSTKSGAGR